MKEFNLERLRGKKVVVNCKTKEQFEEYIKWVSSLNDLSSISNLWKDYREDSCLSLSDNLFWNNFDKCYCKRSGYQIISYEEALLKSNIEKIETPRVHTYIDNLNKEIEEKEKLIKDIKILKCRQNFIKQFRDCVRSVGGDADSISLDITLQEMCDMLAQNGVTFTTQKVDI